jgi:hypothetical protein
MTTSTSIADVKAMTVHLETTMCTEAGVTTALKIAVLLLSHQALESSARPFVGPSFRSDSAPNDSSQV